MLTPIALRFPRLTQGAIKRYNRGVKGLGQRVRA